MTKFVKCEKCGKTEKFIGIEKMTDYFFGFDVEKESEIEIKDGFYCAICGNCEDKLALICVECGKEFESIEERFEHEDKCWLGDV